MTPTGCLEAISRELASRPMPSSMLSRRRSITPSL